MYWTCYTVLQLPFLCVYQIERLSAMEKEKKLAAFSFQNEYGYLNAMKGSKWNALLKTYKEEYQHYLQPVKPLANQFLRELQLQPSYTGPVQLGEVLYEMHGFQTLVWQMKTQEEKHVAADIDIEGNTVWSTEDNSDGAEQYTLKCYKDGNEKWSYVRGVGPFVATVGSRCYCIELENFLWLRRVVSLNKETGKDRQIELDIEDPQWNCQLVKGSNECLFLLANNAGTQRCWYLDKGSFKELSGYQAFVPVGFLSKKSSEPCFFGRKEGRQDYEPVNCTGKFPSFDARTPEWFDPDRHLLCTRFKGKRTVWDTRVGKPVFSTVANLDVDSLGSYRHTQSQITVQEPGSYRQDIGAYLTGSILCPYAKSLSIEAKSKDGTHVPLILVSSCKPKHLLCIVYGAYGVPTRLNTDRWKPLLDRGWGLCFALVRGGGDHTDAWAEEGRRYLKVNSVEDFEACVKVARRHFYLPASQTFVYGRSAGGYTVGSALARNASGSLFQGVYTEVPYVDVLNTTSNPDLPLTKLEYNEFGNPNRLENAQALLQVSPMETLPPTGAPGVFVLSRTALQDKEVYAYESIKWITKLRDLQDKGFPKLLAFEEKEGHFASEATGFQQRANDMAIFHSWCLRNKKSHERIYQMANTRRNNVARKRRNNVTARKNNVVGGKRRKASTRKGRKGRKGTRRH